MRITNHPILNFPEDRKRLTFVFNGKKILAFEGDSIASALHAAGYRMLSQSLKLHKPRGFFCAIGKCSSCEMEVDGVPNVKTCLEPVQEGMVVKSQLGWGTFPVRPKKRVYHRVKIPVKQVEVAVVGAGPAGLSAAIEAARHGARALLLDENHRIGGQLIKQTHMFFGSKEHYAKVRGIDIGTKLAEQCRDLAVEIAADCSVIGYFHPHELAAIEANRLLKVQAQKVIIACGASENMLSFEGNDLPGVYGAGGIQTLMNVYGVMPARRILMVGAGNIGVIVSYQLLQAGVDVVAVVEAAPTIGAYQVHASKLVRCGTPILTSHSIKQAYGVESVEGVTIVRLNENWEEIPGSEQELDVDAVCLAVGLNPAAELFFQAGCKMSFIPELGGNVVWHDENMQTSVEGLYVAGDVAGIEEASSAMLEGRLAGLSAVESLKTTTTVIQQQKEQIRQGLHALRTGPFGEKIRIGEKKMREANPA
ncbi:MAG TPA: FAD-dependent oxidoreductase [bacterium]|nr:FAD-dependent oxidoreductase [bacterium]